MGISLTELGKREESGRKKVEAIRGFLAKNPGIAFTGEEIEEHTKIQCVGGMIGWDYDPLGKYAKNIGIRKKEVQYPEHDMCTTRKYFFVKAKKKAKSKKRWWSKK